MKIPFNKYKEIRELIEGIEGTPESIEEFITKFKNFTGVEKIQLAEDDVFEIEDLDFNDIEDLTCYFTVQPIVDKKYCNKLRELATMCKTREDFCEEATNMTGIPIKQYGTVVRLNNIDFEKKKDLLDYLSAFKVFDKLAELACGYEIAEDGRGILLDGIAYVHDSKRTMIDNPQNEIVPLEGYLSDEEVKWVNIDKSAFRCYNTEKGTLYIINKLAEEDIKTVYPSKPREFGVTEKPYPIAILPKNKYAYIFKN